MTIGLTGQLADRLHGVPERLLFVAHRLSPAAVHLYTGKSSTHVWVFVGRSTEIQSPHGGNDNDT
eukprot:12931389-Heterocapsa_arctica.AAC.1